MLNKIFYFMLVAVFIFFFTNIIFAGEIREKAEKIITEEFSDSDEVIKYKLTIEDELKRNAEKFGLQRFLGKFVYYYEIKKNDEIVNYAILDNVKGKVKPITFLIIFNVDLSVKTVKVIKYREQYGGAIENKNWLAQFSGKSLNSHFELNKAIDGISGATISVKAMIRGVKRLLFLINNLGDDDRSTFVSIK